MARTWDVPKRDLLDIERTSQAESVEAADTLADSVEALLKSLLGGERVAPFAELSRQALTAYRVARGQSVEPMEPAPWSVEEILAREG